MKNRKIALMLLAFSMLVPFAAGAARVTFEISYPSSLDPGPITGRVFVMISRSNQQEPRLQAGSYGGSVPFFGVDVDQLKPGDAAAIDGATLGFPLTSLNDLPAGDYYVQALLNVYTQFHRKDGHVIWANGSRFRASC